jgi:hypothetical protein
MAILILAHAADAGAELVAASAIRRYGAHAVRILRPEVLSLASWSHRVDSHGRATTRLTWPNREAIEDDGVSAVLNRIRYLPVPRFHRAPAKDRDYASLEMQALVASWLSGFGARVVHVVRAHPWLTPALPRQHWSAAAAACGLPVARCTISSSSRAFGLHFRRMPQEPCESDAESVTSSAAAFCKVLVAGTRMGGRLSSTFGPACARVARTLGFPLLEFRFTIAQGTTTLVEVDPFPSLLEPWAQELVVDLMASLSVESLP